MKTIVLYFYTESINRTICYALPEMITANGAIQMLCSLLNDEFNSRGYFDYSRIMLKNMKTGQVLDNDKTLEEQGIKSAMKLELLWKKKE